MACLGCASATVGEEEPELPRFFHLRRCGIFGANASCAAVLPSELKSERPCRSPLTNGAPASSAMTCCLLFAIRVVECAAILNPALRLIFV